MDFPPRSQFENGGSRLAAAQEETFDCRKLTEEEKEALCNAVLFEDEKDPDILLEASSAESTTQAAGNLQTEVKIEEESDINRSPLNAEEDLLEHGAVDDNEDEEEESSDEESRQRFLDEEVLNPRYYSKNTDKRHLFNCPAELCPFSFMKFDHLNEHLKKSHSDEENLSCDVCMKTFSSLDDAVTHLWMRETRKCCGCGKTSGTKGCLLTHIRTHTKPFSCGYCEKRIASKRELEIHERMHTGDKPFVCNVCDYRCVRAFVMKVHKRTHTGERPHTCGYCEKSFIVRRSLKAHERTHTGEKPFECNECGKRFTRRSVLNKHVRLHAGQKPYSCEKCEKKFTRNDNLKRHMKKVHDI